MYLSIYLCIYSFIHLFINFLLFFFRFIIKDKRTFFTNAQRSRIVYELMSRLRYDPDEDDKIGRYSPAPTYLHSLFV